MIGGSVRTRIFSLAGLGVLSLAAMYEVAQLLEDSGTNLDLKVKKFLMDVKAV